MERSEWFGCMDDYGVQKTRHEWSWKTQSDVWEIRAGKLILSHIDSAVRRHEKVHESSAKIWTGVLLPRSSLNNLSTSKDKASA